MVIDCGGGTIDISAYTRASDRTSKEISPAQCRFPPTEESVCS